MSDLRDDEIVELWQQIGPEMRALLLQAFVRHAIDNRGVLTSARRGRETVDQLYSLVVRYMASEAHEQDIVQLATSLAEKGMAMVTATQLMKVLSQSHLLVTAEAEQRAAVLWKLGRFERAFLEGVANARELLHLRIQERSQTALQQALHTQLARQRRMRLAQEERNRSLNQVLQLNTRLARLTDESQLLEQAAKGICQALALNDVTIYEWLGTDNGWLLRNSSATVQQRGEVAAGQDAIALNSAMAGDGETVGSQPNEDGDITFMVTRILHLGEKVMGAMCFLGSRPQEDDEAFLILIRTFAQNLAALWRNISLLTETSSLYQANRQLNTATSENDVYQALVDFARRSELMDMALIVALEPSQPEYLASPVLWSRSQVQFDANDRFLTDEFRFGERLAENRLINIRNTATDPDLDSWTRELFRTYQITSAALVPVHVEDEWLGTLVLNRIEENPFTSEELKPFVSLAAQAAITLSNLRLFNQTESLYRIGRALSQTLSRRDALKLVVREAAQHIGATSGRIILYDEYSGIGEVAASYPPVDAETGGPASVAEVGDQIYEWLSEERQPLLLTQQSPGTPAGIKKQYLDAFKANVSLLIPAVSQQELIGFMALDSQYERLPFNQTNRKFAQTVVDHLTTQIENLKLLDEALRRAQDLITLNQIQSQVTSLLDLRRLAETIYEQIGQLLDNTVFILALFDAKSGDYEPVLCISEGQRISQAKRTLSSNEPLYGFLHEGRVVTADATTPLMRQEAIVTEGGSPQSSFWIPLLNENLPTGLISVQSFEVGAYHDEDAQLMRSIATQTGLAIANARLFERIQASNEQLRQLDTLKDQFLANMSHELRTPLNSIIGFSRVILKGIDGPITAAQEEDLTTIYENGRNLLEMINEILDMAKIGADKMPLAFEMVNLTAIARGTLGTIRSLVDEKEVRLIWDVASDLPSIDADPLRLRQILMNLLSNAAKYTEKGHIRLQIRAMADHIQIAVEDTGIGIAPEDYARIFAPFEQVDKSSTRIAGGTGLGLPITQWLVHMHSGEIWIESVIDNGTTFFVTLPLSQDGSAPDYFPLSRFSVVTKST